jgi:hypothetical protein
MSLESFGTKGTRVQSTKLAIEGIKETAKAIWDKITAAITSMWNSVSAWFAKLFDANTKMGERAKKIAAGAAAAKGKTAAEAEVGGGFIKKLVLEGKFVSKSIGDNLSEVAYLVTSSAKAAMETSRLLQSVKSSEEVAKTIASIDDLVKTNIDIKSTRFLGDKSIKINDGKVTVGSFDETAKEVEQSVAPTADLVVITDIAKNAGSISVAVTAGKKSIDEAQKAVKTFTATMKKLAVGVTDETAASMKEAQAAAPKASANLAALVTKLNGVAVSTAGAALDYAEKSLALYI